MDSVTLAHSDQSGKVPADQAIAQPSPFQNNPANSDFRARVPSALFGSSFTFFVNGAVIESDVAEAAALSWFVREQLSVDCCARELVISESGIESSGIASLQRFFSGSAISVGESEIQMSGSFGNGPLESDFVLSRKADISVTLSGLVSGPGIERGISFESADLSKLSFEALDDLLLRYSVEIESEDELLKFILNLGLSYRFLLRHIEIGFLSAEGLSLLADHFEIPPASVWDLAVKGILHPHPPPGQLDSQIISEFPAIFAEFRGKQFKLLWRGSRDGFSASQFHGRCDGHANTLTVILDPKGTIFGGLTPVEWESPPKPKYKRMTVRKVFFSR
jgi:hypothetical protein